MERVHLFYTLAEELPNIAPCENSVHASSSSYGTATRNSHRLDFPMDNDPVHSSVRI